MSSTIPAKRVGRRSFLKTSAIGAAAALAPAVAPAQAAPLPDASPSSGGFHRTFKSDRRGSARTPASLRPIRNRLQAVLNDAALTRGVAGAVVAVAIGDEEVTLAHGSANLNTGQPFTEDTGFLLGSVTKVLVTTVLLRLVERGLVDLDAPAQRYIPEFTLRDREAASRITVRMLLNHTNGVDAHTLCPWKVRGQEASRSYTRYLPDVGALFEPGTCVTYSNPGFVLATRVIEQVTGLMFEQAMQAELFGPAGMSDATATQTQAFLRRTAIGAFPSATGGLQASPIFTLGEGLAGGGTTLVVSPQDMLSFGRMHLRGGVAPNGTRVLADELVNAMRATSFDLGIAPAPPVGLGWWKHEIAGTTVYAHGGASPGGNSSFAIIPDHDAVIMSFATGPGMSGLNDALHNAAIEELTGRSIAPIVSFEPQPISQDIAGTYRIFQVRAELAVSGEDLVMTRHFEPYDQELREFFAQMWTPQQFPPVIYRSVSPNLFARAGTEPSNYRGYARENLLAVLPATATRPMGFHSGNTFMPKVY